MKYRLAIIIFLLPALSYPQVTVSPDKIVVNEVISSIKTSFVYRLQLVSTSSTAYIPTTYSDIRNENGIPVPNSSIVVTPLLLYKMAFIDLTITLSEAGIYSGKVYVFFTRTEIKVEVPIKLTVQRAIENSSPNEQQIFTLSKPFPFLDKEQHINVKSRLKGRTDSVRVKEFRMKLTGITHSATLNIESSPDIVPQYGQRPHC